MKLAFDLTKPPGNTERNLPPVLLLHGMMDSKKTWSALAHKIAYMTGRKVYSLDLRNHGESQWSDDFNFDILAEDVNEFMQEHNISRAVVIGHSMGGKTALTLALRHPERVEKLIVEDMQARNFPRRAGSVVIQMLMLLRESLNAIPKGATENVARKAVADFVLSLIPPEQASLHKTKNYDLKNMPIKKLENGEYAWQANFDVLEEVLTHPEKLHQQLSGVYFGDALFLYGTKSFFKIPNDDLIPKLFPRAQLKAVENAGHLIHIEQPAKFLQEVVNFIDGRESVISSKL